MLLRAHGRCWGKTRSTAPGSVAFSLKRRKLKMFCQPEINALSTNPISRIRGIV